MILVLFPLQIFWLHLRCVITLCGLFHFLCRLGASSLAILAWLRLSYFLCLFNLTCRFPSVSLSHRHRPLYYSWDYSLCRLRLSSTFHCFYLIRTIIILYRVTSMTIDLTNHIWSVSNLQRVSWLIVPTLFGVLVIYNIILSLHGWSYQPYLDTS